MEEFTPNFTTPHFLLVFSRKEADNHLKKDYPNQLCSTNDQFKLDLIHTEVKPEPACIDDEQGCTVIVGSPILNDKTALKDTAEMIHRCDTLGASELNQLDGEFIVFHFNKKTNKMIVANDRFTSYPLYYFVDEASSTLVASPFYSDIWHYMRDYKQAALDEESIFEFIWFQRVLGTKTHLKDVHFLADATILELADGKMKQSRYWQRNYQKNSQSLHQNAEQLAAVMKQSVAAKTTDGKRYGHFLSGGMDSRSVLCSFADDPNIMPTCFTATISENREFRTAQDIARAKGAPHVGLRLDPEQYGQILDHSVRVVSGMYNYDNGIFYGFDDVVRDKVDVSFHGHGFDYMFQGMYIPGRNVVIGGRTLYLRFIQELPQDLAGHFIANASYRTKRADVWKYVKENSRKHLEEFQRDSVRAILDRGRQMTDDPYDLMEYLTFHHISRHYSYPNHASIATFVEQRTVSFYNDLFDFYLALPINQRFNGKIEKKTLEILNPEVAAIWSANTDLPVTASHWTQTLYQLAGFVKRRIIPEKDEPAWMERTWPGRDDAVKMQASLKQKLQSIFDSKVLEQLSFLDTDLLQKEFSAYVNGEDVKGPSGDFVQAILSVGTFLNQKPEFI